jgi:putative transposase
MPGRNVVKEYVPESYYHIYNRGVNKNNIFLDRQDRIVFLGLLKRYLGDEIEKKLNRKPYPNYQKEVELLAYCLMNNHFHFFIYQESEAAIINLMKSLSVAYSMYFNKRYKRVGAVFQQRYRAVRITSDSQLLHVSRYIHMNPKEYEEYEWSSLRYYLGERSASWVKPSRILKLFDDKKYLAFLKEYDNRREELSLFKDQLANS